MNAARNKREVSKEQVKIIYTLGQELGLVDRTEAKDMLHTLLESMTGKEHVTELTCLEAVQVIDRLKSNMKGRNRIAKPSPPGHRPGMASEGQLRMIWRQMYLLRELDPPDANKNMQQRLRGFIKKWAKIDDIKFLTAQDANKVIEGLKGLVESERKKAGRS